MRALSLFLCVFFVFSLKALRQQQRRKKSPKTLVFVHTNHIYRPISLGWRARMWMYAMWTHSVFDHVFFSLSCLLHRCCRHRRRLCRLVIQIYFCFDFAFASTFEIITRPNKNRHKHSTAYHIAAFLLYWYFYCVFRHRFQSHADLYKNKNKFTFGI